MDVGLGVDVDEGEEVGVEDAVGVIDGVNVGNLVSVSNGSGVGGKVDTAVTKVTVACRVVPGVNVAGTPSTVGKEVIVTTGGGRVGTGPGAEK